MNFNWFQPKLMWAGWSSVSGSVRLNKFQRGCGWVGEQWTMDWQHLRVMKSTLFYIMMTSNFIVTMAVKCLQPFASKVGFIWQIMYRIYRTRHINVTQDCDEGAIKGVMCIKIFKIDPSKSSHLAKQDVECHYRWFITSHWRKSIFMNEDDSIMSKIFLKLVSKGPIVTQSALIQVMAWWCRAGDKPLPELMLTNALGVILRH